LGDEVVGINPTCQLGGEIGENVANIVSIFSPTTSAYMFTRFSHSEDGGSPFLWHVGTLICYTGKKPRRQLLNYDSIFP
jgi:hypothetical protein